ncbi:hypothetical protein ACFQ8C_01000 [Streptomyces sp. NPDC056503]|uniref:hypothetical protein n=1 Tax=Streptomyces sp. NPDC056503 TaxID=3345842 RepID=UPI0036861ED9
MGLLSWLRGGSDGRGAERPAQAADAAPATRPDRAELFDVVELPPIQRTLTAPTLVTDPSSFERGLPTRRPTALSTPLGHLVSAEAPSGLVQGVTAPVQRSVVEFPVREGARPAADGPVTPAPGAPVAPGPVQRATTAPVPAPVPRGSAPEVLGPEPGVGVQRSADAPETPEGPGAADLPEPTAGEPGSVEAAATPSVRPLVGEQRLLDPPEAEAGSGTGSGTGFEAGPGAGSSSVVELPAPGGVRPVQRSLPPSVAPRPPASGSVPAPAPAPAPRRAPGLGAPLPGLPPTAQRATPASVPPSGPAPSPASSPVASPFPGPPPTAQRAASANVPSPGRGPEPLPVQTEAPLSPVPAPVPVPDPGPVVPLLADRPVVTRSVAPETALSATVPDAAPPDTVPVRWEAPAVQRRSQVPTAPSPAPPPAPAPVQRATAHPADRPAPAAARPPRDAGDVAVAAGIAQRMADGSVVFAPRPPSPLPLPPRPLPPAAFVQREVATEEPPPPPPDDPPAAVPDPVPDQEAAEDDSGPPTAAPHAASATGPTAPSGATPPVTDEFVRALYPSLARLLKAELRLERERAGRLIDTRF